MFQQDINPVWTFLCASKTSTMSGLFYFKIIRINGFEHNKLATFELKFQWVPQTLFGGSTWECVLLHEEMKIIY